MPPQPPPAAARQLTPVFGQRRVELEPAPASATLYQVAPVSAATRDRDRVDLLGISNALDAGLQELAPAGAGGGIGPHHAGVTGVNLLD